MATDSDDRKDRPTGGVSRRDFLTTVGAGAVVAATARGASAAPKGPEVVEAGKMMEVELQVNGRGYRLLVEPRWTLLFVLREKLGLMGPKPGCERGECGACTVLIDGIARYSCITLAVEAEDREITSLEGLMSGEDLGPVQQAFVEKDALQCGYCTSGQVVAVEALLRKTPNPSPDEIRTGCSGNLCRCGTYPNIFAAAGRAAELKSGKGGS